ncbi:MAG: hypothetical protein ABEJ28_06960 [Salinigranum sp.]
MVTRNRLVVALVVAYAAVEIAVDNALVFMDLSGQRVPSFTVLLVGALGAKFGAGGDPLASLHRLALLSGVVGFAFVLAAVWQLHRT